MRMKTLMMIALICIGSSLATQAASPTAAGRLSTPGDAPRGAAVADLKTCERLVDNALAICLAHAKGDRVVTKADADTVRNNTASNREEARLSRADARFQVAAARCAGLKGDSQVQCVQAGKAELVKAWTAKPTDSAAADAELEASHN